MHQLAVTSCQPLSFLHQFDSLGNSRSHPEWLGRHALAPSVAGEIVFQTARCTLRMERRTLTVTGMSCSGCEQNVENALRTLDGVSRAEADHESDAVEVVVGGDTSSGDIATAIRDAGYDVGS